MKRINIYSLKQVKEKAGLYNLNSKKINCPDDAHRVITIVLDLQNEPVEKFGIISLNTKNEVTGLHIISVGTVNSTLVHPREIFKAAVLNNATSVILFHNHPSGDPTPSKEDIKITRQIELAGKIIGIDVFDHIIIGDERFYSLREKEDI
ncbi:JAB domain-containing protein [Marinicrinis lubricantis]|uniref:RadC family protein n=1 Tax=Marinicrinis lubricantis TaxID=2086470 RepID=A0ABW1IPE9_9BACL